MTITPEERRLIDEAIEQGRVQRIPSPMSAFDPGAPQSHWHRKDAAAGTPSARRRAAALHRARLRQVADLVRQGLEQQEIARQIGVHRNTVGNLIRVLRERGEL